MAIENVASLTTQSPLLSFFHRLAVNGNEGVLFPRHEDGIRGELFKRLYNHPAADLRSKQRTWRVIDQTEHVLPDCVRADCSSLP